MTHSQSRPARGWAPSRRQTLQAGLGAATLAGTSGIARAAASTATSAEYRRWLIDRTSFGWTPQLDQRVIDDGWSLYLSDEFNLATTADGYAKSIASSKAPTWDQSVYDAWDYLTGSGSTLMNLKWSQTFGSSLPFLMGCLSQRQLRWVMTEFWSNYFNRFLGQEYQQVLWQAYEHEVFHSELSGQALGTFSALLEASAKGASMQLYLNLAENSAGSVNENYARELLELHTVGLDPAGGEDPFTEADVLAVANILTGWRYEPYDTASGGAFRFDDTLNEEAPQTVLGQTFSVVGQARGEQLLTWLAGRESTAKHVATRLCTWFLGEDCPAVVIDRVQDSFFLSGGDIPAVLTTLFHPDTFDDVSAANCRKHRRPFHLATAFCRACKPDPVGNALASPMLKFNLLEQLEKMGQRPGFKPSPDGYPEDDSAWFAALQPRLELVNDLAHTDRYDLWLHPDRVAEIFAGAPVSQYAERASVAITGGRLSPSEILDIQGRIDTWAGMASPPSDEDLGRETLGLLFSIPSMQFLA